jgi:hypothetical protein
MEVYEFAAVERMQGETSQQVVGQNFVVKMPRGRGGSATVCYGVVVMMYGSKYLDQQHPLL